MSGSWAGVRVLVTGGRGFLGSNVVSGLVARGARVTALARPPLPQDDRIGWVAADLTEREAVADVLQRVRPDVVFHMAGQTVAAPEREWVLPAFRNNLTATVVLLHELAEVGCRRVVLTGSLEEPTGAEPIPVSPYGASKWAEVAYARMFHALYRLPVVIARLYMTYGPRQRPDKLIPYVALALLRGDTPVVNQPDRSIDWIYVEDAVEGMLAAARADGVEGRTVEIGSGKLTSIREVAETLRAIVGGSATVQLSKPTRPVGVDGRRADLTETARLLGWSPRTFLRDGLTKTVSWYRENRDARDTA